MICFGVGSACDDVMMGCLLRHHVFGYLSFFQASWYSHDTKIFGIGKNSPNPWCLSFCFVPKNAAWFVIERHGSWFTSSYWLQKTVWCITRVSCSSLTPWLSPAFWAIVAVVSLTDEMAYGYVCFADSLLDCLLLCSCVIGIVIVGLSSIVFSHDMTIMIAGIDEAGRWCWAGPLVMATVCARGPSSVLPLCQDSKALTASRRHTLEQNIVTDPNLVCHIVFFSAQAIDRYGLAYGLKSCLVSLVEFLSTLSMSIDCIVDWPTVWWVGGVGDVSVRPLVRADSLIPEVSAASILAKVARDRWVCEQLDPLYPHYGFAQHKWYGTQKHRHALERYGVCPEHRVSFSLPLSSATHD